MNNASLVAKAKALLLVEKAKARVAMVEFATQTLAPDYSWMEPSTNELPPRRKAT